MHQDEYEAEMRTLKDFLALFYDAIPLSYHQEDVKPHSDSYEVISEEEYLKRKKEREKANSPFANIDIE